jgi:hypothetical protein
MPLRLSSTIRYSPIADRNIARVWTFGYWRNKVGWRKGTSLRAGFEAGVR